MIIQTSYPVFESGQVLMSGHLNDTIEYLEQQDRLTRSTLIGIGVGCGYEVAYEPGNARIRISPGCAVTSEGYLIAEEEESLLGRHRPYSLPVSEGEEDPERLEAARYDPFYEGERQIDLWELLPADHDPDPGEAPSTPIDADFLNDKVVVLFLERELESLKSCDVNDCSDKGSEMNFTLRKLLMTVDAARDLLDREEEYAGRPVDRHEHPRYTLGELEIETINPSRHEIETFFDLEERVVEIVEGIRPRLVESLKAAYDAYDYLLADMYPEERFEAGPFGNPGYLLNVTTSFRKNVFLVQYLYDLFRDLVDSHNEFLRAAFRLEAECGPDPRRFPRHVLLGRPVERPTAFSIELRSAEAARRYDPSEADTEMGPFERPAAYRHHFVPSELCDRERARLEEVRGLHYRTYLLAYRFDTDGRMGAEVRITPSKKAGRPVSERAIPFYYEFVSGDDLHRGWSFERTTENRLDAVPSYRFTSMEAHPLLNRMDDHDFYRTEGIVGKSLGHALRELTSQRRELGLPFVVEPVYLGLGRSGGGASAKLDRAAVKLAERALRPLLLCRMRDLQSTFDVLRAILVRYLTTVIREISRSDTKAVAGLEPQPEEPREAVGEVVDFEYDVETLLSHLGRKKYEKGSATEKIVKAERAPEGSIGSKFLKMRKKPTAENAYDATLGLAKTIAGEEDDPQVIAERIYPSISVLEKAEALLEVTAPTSVQDFDLENFQSAFDGFTATLGQYVEKDPRREVARDPMKEAYKGLVASGTRIVVTALQKEMRQRLTRAFEESRMPEYARRHPGMRHEAGAPAGGTLILLYAHRAFLERILEDDRDAWRERLRALVLERSGGEDVEIDLRNSIEALRAPRTGEPLDDFVVVADFCVPYLCCDAECYDFETAPRPQEPTEREPDRVTVAGSVLARRLRNDELTNPNVAPRSNVEAVHLETGSPVEVEVREGGYVFEGSPGTYRLEVTEPRLPTEVRTITVRGGEHRVEDIVLLPQPRRPNPGRIPSPGGSDR